MACWNWSWGYVCGSKEIGAVMYDEDDDEDDVVCCCC